MLNQPIEQTIGQWPKEPQDSARRLIDYYGEPDEVTPTQLVWHEKAKPWKRTILTAQQAKHDFPSPHNDYVEQFIDYKVPVEKVGDLARYDGSVIVDRTRGELSARCGGTSKNFLAINLAVDIINNRRTVEDARRVYADVAKRFDQGEEDPLTQDFQFQMPAGSTGDPDRSLS